jgi:REP element-mobilizing transposase RayT
MIRMYRASERTTFGHNVALTFTVRCSAPLLASDEAKRALAEHLQETDNYGVDKIRGVAIGPSSVTVIVAIPPARSMSQVAQRIKSQASMAMLRLQPALADRLSGRSLWSRGYGAENLGSRSVAWLEGYLAAKGQATAQG